MRRAICLLGFTVVTVCAACAGRLTEGMPNTLVVLNQAGAKEVIYDLRGDWVGPEGTVTITQDGPVVEGIWKEYTGCCSCPKGHTWFKGTTGGNRVSGFRYLCLSKRAENLTLYITDGGERFDIQALNVDTPTFFDFKRVK
jgi:hypothetical protein